MLKASTNANNIFSFFKLQFIVLPLQCEDGSWFDASVKSPFSALRFTSRHFNVRPSRYHSSRFARLETGAFYETVWNRLFTTPSWLKRCGMVGRYRRRSAGEKEYISAKLAQCAVGFNKIIKHLFGD
jgi:hypothetical protein